MRKLLWMAVIAVLVALPLGAGEPGGPGQGGQGQGGPGQGGPGPGGQPQMGPGGRPGGFPGGGPPPNMGPGGMSDALTRTQIFDAARKAVLLPDDAMRGVDSLDAQFGDDLRAAITEARLKLSRDYVAKVLALLPDDQKPKYEVVAKALTARDEAVAATQKELRAVLDKVKTSQGANKAARDGRRRPSPGGDSLTSKVEILRTHFVLTEQQQQALDENQRLNFDAMRERMGNLFAGLRDRGGPQDPDAFRRAEQAMTQVREELENETAANVAEFFTPEQKKDYTAACAAIDVSRKTTKEAEAACRKTITDAVGERKANALLGPPPGQVATPKKGAEF